MIDKKTARVAAEWWASQLQIEDKREAFRLTLERLLRAGVFGFHEDYLWGVRLEVDYDPGATLLAALREVGIECRGFMFSADGLLPRKTCMRIFNNGSIDVSDSYGETMQHIAGPPAPIH